MLFSTKKTPLRAKKEAEGVPWLQAATFWPQNKAGPVYRGLISYHANRELRREAESRDCDGEAFRKKGAYETFGNGLGAFVRATHRRLAAMENGRGHYTRTHSREVATFAWTIITEAIQRGYKEASGVDPGCIFAGGYGHDVGKTALPLALIDKECGIEVGWLKLLLGVRLTLVERSTLRYEHIALGSALARIYWDRRQDPEFSIVQDMIGLHHVTFNGLGAYPSYPQGKCGKDLPLHCRIAKTADFVSAVLPRPYRPVYQQQWITRFEQAIGYAIAVAGTELDPLAVSCLLTGMYDITPGAADSLVQKLGFTGNVEKLSDMEFVRTHVTKNICENAGFIDVMKRRHTRKIAAYTDRIIDYAERFGIEIAPDFPVSSLYEQKLKGVCV